MTRVQIHDLATVPPQSADALKALDHKFGTTLNIFGAMANSPAVLNTFVAFEASVAEHTSLDRKTREAIHLTVANVNECTYCQGAYTMAAKAAGFDEDQTKQIRRGVLDGDDKLTALLALTREIAANRGSVDDATWRSAVDAGWSEQQLLQAFADTARTIFTNYFNHFVETEQDVPEVPPV
jgi:AhpD family alkylhydroperoxidase